jgi:uncharacterized protein YndB with AHSA1/START domain
MAHAENSITIDRPINAVFAFVLDGTNNHLWRPAVVDCHQVPGTPAGVGATYKQELRGPGGRPFDADYRIVECTPNSLIGFEVIAGPARPSGTYRFESVGEATRVTFTLHHEPTGLARLMEHMVAQTLQGAVATLANLKDYLEHRQS